MKTINLFGGKQAKVDDWDYEVLKNYRWHLAPTGYAQNSKYRGNYKSVNTLMHRAILWSPPGYEVDHVNGDKLDNRKENLRIASRSENEQNKAPSVKNHSGFKGVSWDRLRSKWRASIGVNRKSVHLGRFDSKTDAIRAYDAAVERYYQDGRVNGIPKGIFVLN